MYLIARKINDNENGSVALKLKRNKENADYISKLQEKLGYDIELIKLTGFMKN